MEPLVSSSAPAVLRPAAVALQSDLAALLRDGRLLAGELVAGPTDGQVLLAIGRHHVPAHSNVRLDPGRPFLFRVEETRSGIVLHVLDGAQAEEPALLRALRAVVAHERPIGTVLAELLARVRAQAAEPGSPGAPDSRAAGRAELLRTLLALVSAHVATAATDGAGLRQLLQRSGQHYESQLLAAARASPSGELSAATQDDLKGQLLRLLRAAGEPALREDLARALAGIEAEQLLNVARERSGEPQVWSLPIHDGAEWSTLRLSFAVRGEREGEKPGAGRLALRVVLGLALTHTGPLRIDLLATEEALSVRFLVESEELARRIAADADEIAGALAAEGRSVHVAARRGTPEEVALSERPLDTRYLAEHHLMDVSG